MKKLLARLAWPAAIVAAVVAVYAYQATRPVAVETALVRQGPIEEYVTDQAWTQLHTTRVVTADLPGTAQRVTLEEGDVVRRGDLITTVSDAELASYVKVVRAQIAEVEGRLAGADVTLPKPSAIAAAAAEHDGAVAELAAVTQQKAASEADLALAQKERARIGELYQSGRATDRQSDEAQRALHVAEATVAALSHRCVAADMAARVAQLRKQVLDESMHDTAYLRLVYGAQMEQNKHTLDIVEYELAKTRVVSPLDGIVLEKHLDSDQYVQPGAALVTIGDPASMEIRADILSDEIARVRPGQKVLLVGKAIRKADSSGVVKKIYPSGFTKVSSLGVRQQRVIVLIAFDNSQLNLQPGYELDVKIAVAEKEGAPLVPSAAVFATARGSSVFVVRNGRAELRPVSVGLKGEQDYEALAGLQAGEAVILRPPSNLSPGSRVRSSAPSAAPAASPPR